MKYSLFIFLITILTCLESNSQEVIKCSTMELHEQNMQDEGYRAQFQAKMNAVDKVLSDPDYVREPFCADPIVIPVAVHFQGTGLGIACATDMAVDQINRLNLDYAGTNVDIGNWTAAQGTFPGISNGESCIQFCLATINHPPGFGLSNGDYAITLDQTAGDFDAAWSGYLNFWVRDLGGGLLGYSPLGGNGNGDGVAITVSAFGSISCDGNIISGTYNLGRTATHEVGHYLLLQHPWGGGGCASSDLVADTPVTDGPQFGCPALGFVSCTDPVLWMSYMDYVDDPCMYMFSAGQVDRMDTYASGSLMALANNSSTVCIDELCNDFYVNHTKSDETCFGNDGNITLSSVDGNAPYSYSINGGLTSQSSNVFNGLSQGTYDVLVVDDVGCDYEFTVTLGREQTQLSITGVDKSFCGFANGSLEVAADVPIAFEYSITDGLTWQNSPSFENLFPGWYTVYAQHVNGCSGQLNVFVDDENDLDIAIENVKPINCFYYDNGSISFSVGGGEPPFSYSLDENPEETSVPYFGNLSEGNHTVHISDERDCQTQIDFQIGRSFASFDDDCPCKVFVPNAITPDGDGLNDRLILVPSCPITNFDLKIFDRFGHIVFESTDVNYSWNGGSDKEYYMQTSIYIYYLTYQWGFDSESAVEEDVVGSVTVVR